VGVLVSLFTAMVVTRVLVELVARSGAVRRRPRLLGLDGGGRLAGWLATRGPDLIAKGRWWLAASLVALVVVAAGLVVRGPNLGLEFTGGRLLEYRTERRGPPGPGRGGVPPGGGAGLGGRRPDRAHRPAGRGR
jgi:SecD/SecF fusion protein